MSIREINYLASFCNTGESSRCCGLHCDMLSSATVVFEKGIENSCLPTEAPASHAHRAEEHGHASGNMGRKWDTGVPLEGGSGLVFGPT